MQKNRWFEAGEEMKQRTLGEVPDPASEFEIANKRYVDNSPLAQLGATDGQVLTWSNANSRWEPQDP